MNHWLLLESHFDSGDGQNHIYPVYMWSNQSVFLYGGLHVYRSLEIHIFKTEGKEVRSICCLKSETRIKSQSSVQEGQHLFNTMQ